MRDSKLPIKASDPRPVPDPMKRRKFRTQSIDEASGIFRCAASWLSPSLDPLYMAGRIQVTNSTLQ